MNVPGMVSNSCRESAFHRMPSIRFAQVCKAGLTFQAGSDKPQLGIRGETAGAAEKEVGNADSGAPVFHP
jgi:hypothetical protein